MSAPFATLDDETVSPLLEGSNDISDFDFSDDGSKCARKYLYDHENSDHIMDVSITARSEVIDKLLNSHAISPVPVEQEDCQLCLHIELKNGTGSKFTAFRAVIRKSSALLLSGDITVSGHVFIAATVNEAGNLFLHFARWRRLDTVLSISLQQYLSRADKDDGLPDINDSDLFATDKALNKNALVRLHSNEKFEKLSVDIGLHFEKNFGVSPTMISSCKRELVSANRPTEETADASKQSQPENEKSTDGENSSGHKETMNANNNFNAENHQEVNAGDKTQQSEQENKSDIIDLVDDDGSSGNDTSNEKRKDVIADHNQTGSITAPKKKRSSEVAMLEANAEHIRSNGQPRTRSKNVIRSQEVTASTNGNDSSHHKSGDESFSDTDNNASSSGRKKGRSATKKSTPAPASRRGAKEANSGGRCSGNSRKNNQSTTPASATPKTTNSSVPVNKQAVTITTANEEDTSFDYLKSMSRLLGSSAPKKDNGLCSSESIFQMRLELEAARSESAKILAQKEGLHLLIQEKNASSAKLDETHQYYFKELSSIHNNNYSTLVTSTIPRVLSTVE